MQASGLPPLIPLRLKSRRGLRMMKRPFVFCSKLTDLPGEGENIHWIQPCAFHVGVPIWIHQLFPLPDPLTAATCLRWWSNMEALLRPQFSCLDPNWPPLWVFLRFLRVCFAIAISQSWLMLVAVTEYINSQWLNSEKAYFSLTENPQWIFLVGVLSCTLLPQEETRAPSTVWLHHLWVFFTSWPSL